MDSDSDPEASGTTLNARQRQALAQLRDLTNGADDEVAIGMLRAVEWDVQRAAELIFDSAPGPASGSHQFESHLPTTAYPPAPQTPHHVPRPTPTSFAAIARPLLTILALPLHVLATLARLFLAALRAPLALLLPARAGYAPLPGTRPGWFGTGSGWSWSLAGLGLSRRGQGGVGTGASGPGGPAGAAARWVRELEEETGALSSGGGAAGASSGVAGPSAGLVARPGKSEGERADDVRSLPAFVVCAYEEFLRRCKAETCIGCVVLVSAEHDSVAAFKRTTLTDPAFNRALQENSILIWGGDVRDADAWSAGEKLQATTFPFVAFLALQPQRAPPSSSAHSSSGSPTLTVLSRHQGPAVPSSAPTSATTLCTHLSAQLLPRVTPYLGRLAGAARARASERALRAEQDAAFASTAARDRERIEASMAAEREKKAAARAAEDAAREAEVLRLAEIAAREARAAERLKWRRWTRRAVVAPLASAEKERGALRVAIRLPSGGRVVRAFGARATLTSLYAVVDAALLPPDLDPAEDPATLDSIPPAADAEGALDARVVEAGGEGGDAHWGFRVVSAYPRVEIPWVQGLPLAEVGALRGGGQVVVELLGGPGAAKERAQDAGDGDDDGYDTEESE